MIRQYLGMTALLFSCFIASHAFAASSDSCGSDSAHCTYINGLHQDLNKGRYVKTVYQDGDTFVDCLPDAFFTLDQEDAAAYLGQNTDHYYICSDSDGKDCALAGVDSYTITQTNGKYSSTPLSTSIDFTNLVNNYPDCKVPTSKRFIRHR